MDPCLCLQNGTDCPAPYWKLGNTETCYEYNTTTPVFTTLTIHVYLLKAIPKEKFKSLKVPTFTHLYNNIYILPLTGTPEQQLFTVWGGVLNCTSNRQCGAITDCPLPEWTYFEPTVAARQTHLCSSQPHYGLHPTMFSGKDSLFYLSSEYYKLHIRRDGRLSWLKRYKCK